MSPTYTNRRLWTLVTSVLVLVALTLASLGSFGDSPSGLGLGSGLTLTPIRNRLTGLGASDAWGAEAPLCSPAKARADQCSVQADLDDIEARWGERALKMGEAYLGSGDRTRRFVSRLASGQPISLAILGGSITAGHSLNFTAGEITWSQMLFNWIQERYPHPDHSYVSGAVPATGVDYFATCYSLHVPIDADLYVLEGAVNDAYVDRLADSGTDIDVVDYTETLVRELLSTPETALIMLSLWAVPHPYLNGADKHAIVSEYYDIPRLSERAWLYKYFMQHQDELVDHFNQQDFGHQNEKGHRYIADLLIWYLSNQVCAYERRLAHPLSLPATQGTDVPSAYAPAFVPPVTVRQLLREKARPAPAAFCASTNARDEHGEWLLQPSRSEGFERLSMHGKSWWAADKPGAEITFPNIKVSSGRVGIYYYRSSAPLGNMHCWVDNDSANGRTLPGMWNYVSVGSYAHIRDRVPPGLHSVTCRVLEETNDPAGESHHVRIIAVLAN
ncbi:hypothetical protein Q5752_004169 [Cryptotrichosporon argae]